MLMKILFVGVCVCFVLVFFVFSGKKLFFPCVKPSEKTIPEEEKDF